MAKPDLTKIKEERQRLQARLAELEEVEAQERERMAAVAGKAVLAEAEQNADVKAMLDSILAQRVRKNADRALFGLARRERKRVPADQQAEAFGTTVKNG